MEKVKTQFIRGHKYGFLTYMADKIKEGSSCKGKFNCDCGNVVYKELSSIKKTIRRGFKPCCQKTCPVGAYQYTKDYSGSRYGHLLILVKLNEKKNNCYLYRCLCDCGKEVKLTPNSFATKLGNKSCGCMQRKGKQKDITGIKKNKLTAIKSTDKKSSNGDYIWQFSCDCGSICETTIGRFNSGHTSSCGCARKDSHKLRTDYHGMSKTSTYKAWVKIRERCCNPNCDDYKHYGAIGISVCDDWLNDFNQFYKDMGDKPDESYTIDRIDNLLGYSKENCRWSSQKHQARNKFGLQINNKSGFKGVHLDEKAPNSFYAKASWRNLDGSYGHKSYSLKLYGEELAMFMACEHRQHQIDIMNVQGAGYSEQHMLNIYHNRW